MENAHYPVKVYIVDDSLVIRERLVELIDAMPEAQVVGEAESAADAIAGILQVHPDCVVLDLQLRESNGLSVLRAVHPQAPDIVFMVLTNHASAQYCRLCMTSGAKYFFDKSNEVSRVREAISAVATQPNRH